MASPDNPPDAALPPNVFAVVPKARAGALPFWLAAPHHDSGSVVPGVQMAIARAM